VIKVEFQHLSVLLAETVDAVLTNPDGIYVDCTLGGGGHAAALASRLSPAALLIGIDQDPAAIAAGRERLATAVCRVELVQDNFRNLDKILDELNIAAIDGVIFDLGVSSHQLDVAERGFSYMHDGPLDMRMNPDSKLSAADIVNNYSEAELTRIIREYGEERWAKRIAEFIVRARASAPIKTTGQLAEIIKQAIPASARRDGPHPAKRTFQAIRITVNDELNILAGALKTAIERLKPGGRIAVITFHSLEDRIAKQTLQDLAKGCICPPRLPVCVCQHQPLVKILGKPIVPSATEVANNPRARSDKLRVAEKV